MTMRMSALDSDMTPSKKPKVIRRSDESENISKTKDALNSYLKDLVQLPEVIVSENIISFFDEESVDGEIVKPSQEVSDVDILISGESRKSKTILRHFKVKKDIEAGEVVIWEFSTKYYDIGFSVTFNGSEVVAFQRHNSHVKPVRGCLELSEDGNLELIWDNTYSKMRSKQISYIVHVVSKMEFVTARSFAIEASKERFQYAQQRAQLKKVLMRVSRESMTPQATLAASTTEDVDEATRYRVKVISQQRFAMDINFYFLRCKAFQASGLAVLFLVHKPLQLFSSLGFLFCLYHTRVLMKSWQSYAMKRNRFSWRWRPQRPLW